MRRRRKVRKESVVYVKRLKRLVTTVLFSTVLIDAKVSLKRTTNVSVLRDSKLNNVSRALVVVFSSELMAMELDIATEVETVGHIHIRNQKRNGRKSLTTVQGIPVKYSLNKIIKYLKSQLNCNGTIVDDAEHGQIIQLHGDKRKEIADFLYEQGISERESIKVHGA